MIREINYERKIRQRIKNQYLYNSISCCHSFMLMQVEQTPVVL